jgi:hypothetical protein
MNEVSVLYLMIDRTLAGTVTGTTESVRQDENGSKWKVRQLNTNTPAIVLVGQPTSSNMLPQIEHENSVKNHSEAKRSALAKPVVIDCTRQCKSVTCLV